jgi:hypothetical protein
VMFDHQNSYNMTMGTGTTSHITMRGNFRVP